MKSKVENGEVIERLEAIMLPSKKRGWHITDIEQANKLEEDFKILLTNALNQQRLEIVGELEQLIQAEEQGYISVNSKTLKAMLNKYKT